MYSPQIRLANEIAVQFHHQPPDKAATAVATHIRQFWDPRMRADLRRQIEAGSRGADPVVIAAVALLD
ncbi:formate dehydrogenase subunit delta [Amycolatopsis alkalitolerans]|uniref:Formate dehydrogenase n=1 Tax=Amycolatopsis alkalitolerans TaxID=2547244 RepID=A0A5C4M177_9PSEU|nr:formate dehydrogenase subunit delta [Amycolatopsis alkalitolerans]TNC25098.1 formate dehydrogenase [Amycolatopsis alkalitolerans]